MRKHELYQDVRGSMTQFGPITPEQVKAVSDGALTYTALSEMLASLGLSCDKVLHDPSRSIINTFYVDYDRGLYCPLYLQMPDFMSAHRLLLQMTFNGCEQGSQRLKVQDWDSFYFIDVPLPMAPYDFQRRMRHIPTEQVFSIWLQIHKRLDCANGIWLPETLEYVFEHAPPAELPPVQKNGLVKLYRGMGELSQAANVAISWSTNAGNALWFANHSGFGTHMLIGEVAPADVVAYLPGFSNENEVIVRPYTVQNIHSADMLSANIETFTSLAAPLLHEFTTFCRWAMRQKIYGETRSHGDVHGLLHNLRVLFLVLVYYYHAGDVLSNEDKEIMVYFSLLHDIGRCHDGEDDCHGDAAAAMIRSMNLRVKGIHLTKKGHRIAELIIRHHCREDQLGIAAIHAEAGFSSKDKQRSVRLFQICKDADALDRVRFNGLDYRMLRTPFAAKLPLIAGCLLKEDIFKFVEERKFETPTIQQ